MRILLLMSLFLPGIFFLSACAINSKAGQDNHKRAHTKYELSPLTVTKLPPVDTRNVTEIKLRAELETAEAKFGTDSQEVMEVLKRLGKYYRSISDPETSNPKEGGVYDKMARIRWAEKIKKLRQNLEQSKNIHGENSSEYIESLLQLTKFLQSMSSRAEKVLMIDDLVEGARITYGGDRSDYANILVEVARMLEASASTEKAINRLSNISEELMRAESLLIDAIRIYSGSKNHNVRMRKKAVSLLSGMYRATRRFDKLVKLHEQNLEIEYRNENNKQNSIAQGLFSIGKKYGRNNRLSGYEAAIFILKRSIELDKELYGEEHRYIAVSMHELGKVYERMTLFTNALHAYKISLTISKKLYPGGNTDVALGLKDLAKVYQKLGLYDLALPKFKDSLKLYEKLLPNAHSRVLNSYHNLSSLLVDMGDYSKALGFSQRVLDILKAKDKPNAADVANAMNSLAIIYENMGDYSNASLLYTRALTNIEKNNGSHYPKILGNYAVLLGKLGQHTKALSMHEKSTAIYNRTRPKNNLSIAKERGNLGVLFLQMEKPEKAIPLMEQSLRIWGNIYSENHPLIAMNLNNLASAYAKTGQVDRAISLHRRISKIYKKIFSGDNPTVAIHLNNLAHLYLSSGDLKKSEELMFKSATLAQDGQGNMEILWRVQSGLGLLYTKLNRHGLAIFWGKESVNTIQGLRENLTGLDKEANRGFLHNKRYVYQNLADLLIAEGRIGEAQAVLQMLKEYELHDIMQRSSKTDPRSTRIELTGLERKRFSKYYELQDKQAGLGKERTVLERKLKLGEISETEKKRLAEINNQLLPPLREAMLVFLQNLQKQSDQFAKDKAYRQGESQLEMTETNLQKAMTQVQQNDPDARIAALQYVVTENRLSILLSTPNNPPIAKQIEFDGKSLRSQVFTVRELLSDPKSDRDILKKHLQSLHTMLITPIAEDLNALKTKTLILVPNDVLRYIPFAALYDGKRYLVQDYTLTLFNEAVKKDFKSKPAKTWQLAAMGLSLPVENLPALTNVVDELEAVAITSGMQGKTYLDDAFTRVVLTDALKQDFNVLHLASHFEFVAGRPDASRLFLGDKSSLYLGDIAREDMRFDKFALVTFSACETGLGGGLDADGRDMESLGALVQNQGARAVMATLWKVEDSSTASLMEMFYRVRHERKLEKAAALRKAQLKFIKRGGGKSVLAHPYYWAPFVLMGDWR